MSPFYITVMIIIGIIAAMFCFFVYTCWYEENGKNSKKKKAAKVDEMGDMDRALADREKLLSNAEKPASTEIPAN